MESIVDQWMEELQKSGSVVVPDLNEEGVYRVSIAMTGPYGTPMVEFMANAKYTGFTGYYSTKSWRQIPWYINYSGKVMSRYHGNNRMSLEDLARTVLGVIASGRRLSLMTCGDTISSLNQSP